MFYFLHSQQGADNASHYRGLLFEDLLRSYLAARGYVIDGLRRKHNSLEYDIEAHHDTDGRNLLGEAKHRREISEAQNLRPS